VGIQRDLVQRVEERLPRWLGRFAVLEAEFGIEAQGCPHLGKLYIERSQINLIHVHNGKDEPRAVL
jgi:hypothetical protein